MTSIYGRFILDKALASNHQEYLRAFCTGEHKIWDEERIRSYPDPLREAVGLPIGLQGMYFTGVKNFDYDAVSSCILSNYFYPPYDFGQHGSSEEEVRARYPLAFELPSAHCPWIPTEDGTAMVWDELEQFLNRPVAWLQLLLTHFLVPWGYQLSGEVAYAAFEEGTRGRFIVVENQVTEVCDRASFFPYPRIDLGDVPVIKDYWFVVGLVSEEAREALQQAHCWFRDYPGDVPVVLVKVSYDANAYKLHGYNDLSIFLGQLSVRSIGLCVSWSRVGVYQGVDTGIVDSYLSMGSENWLPILDNLPIVSGIYWLAVGSLTAATQNALWEADCVVRTLHEQPTIMLVGLRFDTTYRQQYGRSDIQTSGGQISIQSKNLHLFCQGSGEMPLWIESIVDITLMLASERGPEVREYVDPIERYKEPKKKRQPLPREKREQITAMFKAMQIDIKDPYEGCP